MLLNTKWKINSEKQNFRQSHQFSKNGAICVWFQFLPSFQRLHESNRKINATNQINMLNALYSVSIDFFSEFTRVVNNRCLPTVLTGIDVLSVSKHKSDVLKNNHTQFIVVRYIYSDGKTDWFITFACETRGETCVEEKNIAIFRIFTKNQVNCSRHVIILARFNGICRTKNQIRTETIFLFLLYFWNESVVLEKRRFWRFICTSIVTKVQKKQTLMEQHKNWFMFSDIVLQHISGFNIFSVKWWVFYLNLVLVCLFNWKWHWGAAF